MKLTVKPSQKYKGVGDWGGGGVSFSFFLSFKHCKHHCTFNIFNIANQTSAASRCEGHFEKRFQFCKKLGVQFGFSVWVDYFCWREAVGVPLNPMYLIYNKQIGYWKNLIVKGCSTHILAYFLLMESCKQDFWSNNPFAMITSQFELHLKCRFLLVQKKKVISMNYSNSTIS